MSNGDARGKQKVITALTTSPSVCQCTMVITMLGEFLLAFCESSTDNSQNEYSTTGRLVQEVHSKWLCCYISPRSARAFHLTWPYRCHHQPSASLSVFPSLDLQAVLIDKHGTLTD